MISLLKKLFHWHLFLLIFLISIANTVNAQWVMVDTSGIPKCYTSDRKYIYAGFHGGFYHPEDTAAARNIIRSSDGGVTWENASNGLTSGNMYSLDVQSLCAVGNVVLAGTRNGIFVSSNHGDSWVQSNFNPLYGETFAFLVVDTLIFAGTDAVLWDIDSGGIFLSTNYGQSWVRSDSGLEEGNGSRRVKSFAKIGSTLFAGTYGDGVFYSTDMGKNWINPTNGGGKAYSLAVIDSTLFMGNSSGYPQRTFDMGNNWSVSDSGFSMYGVPYLAAADNILIAGTVLNGIYFSSNMGDYWKQTNEGLDSTNPSLSYGITSIAIINNYVFAGNGYGLWRRPLSEITSVEKLNPASPKEFELNQNYPNPFNPTTIISYHLSAASDINLKIYDILGREIIVLVNERQTAGEHSVRFSAKGGNGTNLPSGVYFYRLTANGYNAVKKMLLIR